MSIWNGSGSSLPLPDVGEEGYYLKVVLGAPAWAAIAEPLVYKGVLDCSANPNYPASTAGWVWVASSAGKIGGASGVSVNAGDTIYCSQTNGGGTQAAVGADFQIVHSSGAGQVVGPLSSTDTALARFSGTDGRLLQDYASDAPTVTSAGVMSVPGGILAQKAFLVSGTTGGVSATGAGTRLMWVPSKAALRAGVVTGTNWDLASIGTASAAFGSDSKASGASALAAGSSLASGDSASAFGASTASGNFSGATGLGVVAQGYCQTAVGLYNVANGTQGFKSSTDHAFIIGNGASAGARSNAFTVDWSGNVDIPTGAQYKINGTALSYADVGAAPVFASQLANKVYASPDGSAGVPVFRSLVANDIPTLNQSTTGTAANLSGTPTLPDGTKAATQTQGDNSTKLATTAYVDAGLSGKISTYGSQSASRFLASPALASGTPSFRAIAATDIPTLNQSTTGSAASLSAACALVNGTTATTQSFRDNSTKVATTAYADAVSTLLKMTSASSGPYSLTSATDLLVATGTFTVNLPAATGTGKVYRIKSLNGTVTVTPSGAETIDGLSGPRLLSGVPGVAQPTLTIVDGGSGVWHIL